MKCVSLFEISGFNIIYVVNKVDKHKFAGVCAHFVRNELQIKVGNDFYQWNIHKFLLFAKFYNSRSTVSTL